jgi:hypothetical protein
MGRTKKNYSENNFYNDDKKLSNKIIKYTKSIKSDDITSLISDTSTNTTNTTNTTNITNTINISDTNIIEINNFKKKEKMLYDVINDFFKKCSEEEINKITDIIDGKYKISLRFLDWFVTRYCYLYKTSIPINNNYNKEQDFNINISYKAQLKSFKKKCFDPFKRKNKFYYSFDLKNQNPNPNPVLTTLGQLNFFKWALSFDVIKFVENNFDTINNKITYVNTFFKKNIIDNTTSSIISSDELKSKLSQSDISMSNISNISNISNTDSESNNLNNSSLKKKVHSNYPIVARNIFVEF